MLELLRNCSQNNGIATYRSDTGAIIKVSSDPEGGKRLRNEVNGWKWYGTRRYGKPCSCCRVVREAPGYLKIEIERIKGISPRCRDGVSKNIKWLEAASCHYMDIWQDGVLHGDLSLENMIFNEKGVHFIDWEHFNEKAAPLGFDLFYLFFETLYFGSARKPWLSMRELSLLSGLIARIHVKHSLQEDLSARPLKAVREFIRSNSRLWGEGICLERKFPVLFFSEKQVDQIDDVCRRK